jgi:hypothetical protein
VLLSCTAAVDVWYRGRLPGSPEDHRIHYFSFLIVLDSRATYVGLQGLAVVCPRAVIIRYCPEGSVLSQIAALAPSPADLGARELPREGWVLSRELATPDDWPGQMPTSWLKPKAQNSKTEIVGLADGPCGCRRQPSATLTPAASLFFYSSEEEITHGRLVRAPDCHSDGYDGSRCNRCGVSAFVDLVKDKSRLVGGNCAPLRQSED